MSTIKDQAVILRRIDFSETSQVLALFTRQSGKVRVIAKGVKRSTRTRFAPAVDLLDIGEAVIAGRYRDRDRLAVLTEWTPTLPVTGLRNDLVRLYAGQYLAALTAELTEDGDPHPGLFDALCLGLTDLSRGQPPLGVVVRFQHSLLVAVGSMPDFTRCVGCRGAVPPTGDVYFSSFEGGLLCRDCEAARSEKYLIHSAGRSLLAGDRGSDSGERVALAVLDYHLAHLMGRRLPLGRTLLELAR